MEFSTGFPAFANEYLSFEPFVFVPIPLMEMFVAEAVKKFNHKE